MYILHDSGNYLTAKEILDYVRARVAGVNKSTIYRTLELLEVLGCVFKSELGDRYIYHHAEEGRHNHLVCSVCGKNIDCDEDIFLPVEAALDEKYGFKVALAFVGFEADYHNDLREQRPNEYQISTAFT